MGPEWSPSPEDRSSALLTLEDRAPEGDAPHQERGNAEQGSPPGCHLDCAFALARLELLAQHAAGPRLGLDQEVVTVLEAVSEGLGPLLDDAVARCAHSKKVPLFTGFTSTRTASSAACAKSSCCVDPYCCQTHHLLKVRRNSYPVQLPGTYIFHQSYA